MPAAVDHDRTAFEGPAPGWTRIVTTFYDLITVLHESIEPGEEDLVTAAVVHLVNAGHVTCLERPQRGAGIAQGLGAAVVVHDSSSQAGAGRVVASGERSRGAGAPCRGYFLDTQEFLSQRASR